MKTCYQLRLVLFSWRLFQLFPSVFELGENDKHFGGFAVDWLGFEWAFEKLKEDGCRLRSKAEIGEK